MAPRRDNEIDQLEEHQQQIAYQDDQDEDSMADDRVFLIDLADQVRAREARETHGNVLNDDKNSKKNKKRSALNHFNDFLSTYWKTMRPNDQVLPDHPLYEHVTIADLSPNLFGCFAYHLAHAENKSKKEKFISMNSAHGYLSSVKSYFRQREDYRKLQQERPCFLPHNWHEINSNLTSVIVERHKATGDPLINPKASAKTDDWIALACICVWMGTQKYIEFWCIFVALVHMAARVNEAAFLRVEDVSTIKIPMDHQEVNRVALFTVNNYKQSTHQFMHVFPHISLWHLDYYFAMAVFWATSDATSDFLFPTFGQLSQKTNKEGKKDTSGIVKHFTNCLNRCVEYFNTYIRKDTPTEDLFGELPNDLTMNLCSHSPKKHAVNLMGRELTPVYVIFRAGWAVRNAHTIFDYLIKDVVHDVKAAKVCAGWTSKWFDDIWGGYTNRLTDLKTERGKFRPFCQALFKYQHGRMDQELMYLHGLSVLRFHEDFVESLKLHPPEDLLVEDQEDQDERPKHPFLYAVQEALAQALVSQATFAEWQKEVREGFQTRNAYALSLKQVPQMNVDARTLIGRMEQIERVGLNTGQQVDSTKDAIKELVSLNKELVSLNKELLAVNKRSQARILRLEEMMSIHMLQHSGSPPMLPPLPNAQNINQQEDGSMDGATNDMGGVNPPGATIPTGLPTPFPNQRPTTMSYDVLVLQRYKDQAIPIPKLFLAWFVEQLPVAYENYKTSRTSKGKNLTKKEKNHHKTVKNHFSICKTAVHVLLKNLDSYPSEDDDLEALANQALASICERHNLSKIPPRTRLAGKTNSIFKEGNYVDLPFPGNTPDYILEYFSHRGFHDNGRPLKSPDEGGERTEHAVGVEAEQQ